MDLRQLRTFRAVAELGSLSRAADKLRIAQPALSRQIRLLEHELRTPLFIRHGRGMVLTEAGRILLDRTAGLVHRLEQARADVLACSGQPSGRVIIGMVPTVGGTLAARLVQRVVEQLPGVELRLVEAYGSYLTEWLYKGEIDLAVVYGPQQNVHLRTTALRQDELHVVSAPGGWLDGLNDVTFEQLEGQPLVEQAEVAGEVLLELLLLLIEVSIHTLKHTFNGFRLLAELFGDLFNLRLDCYNFIQRCLCPRHLILLEILHDYLQLLDVRLDDLEFGCLI